MNAKSRPKVTIEAVITRADGIVENLGVIARSEDEENEGNAFFSMKRLGKWLRELGKEDKK